MNTNPILSNPPDKKKRTIYRGGKLFLIFALLLPTVSCSSKRDNAGAANPADQPRIETIRHNGITLNMTLTPGSVSLNQDIILTIQLKHPESVSVSLPPLADRLQGLLAVSAYDRESAPAADGWVVFERVAKLTPRIGSEYRIAPMAVAFRNAIGDGETAWFATPAITLPVSAVMDGPVDETLRGEIRPIPIRPSLKTLSGYAAVLVAVAILLALAVYLLSRIKRQIRIMRLSPKERALHELERLLAKKLVETGHVKDFYVELTLIVRHYIERRHRVRAPEQTTQEFLLAISTDPRFSRHVVDRLKQFLEAADLVKFATWRPDRHTVDNAVFSARDYLTSDGDAINGNTPTAPDKE